MLRQLFASAALALGMAASAVTLNMGEQFGTVNIDEITSWTQEGFTFTPSVGENAKGKVPCYKSKNQEVRLYALNTLTISAPAGQTISAISFTLSKQGREEQAVISASVGKVAAQTVNGPTVSWCGSESAVTFTVGETNSLHPEGILDGSGQFDFTEIAITIDGEEPQEPTPGLEFMMGEQFGAANIDVLTEWIQNEYTFIPSVGENTKGKVPCYKSKNQEVRLYALNTLTVRAPEGIKIKSLTFTLSKQGIEEQAVLTSDCGTVAEQTAGNKNVTWNGAANEITFTVGETNSLHPEGILDGSGQFDFTSLTIETEQGESTIIAINFAASRESEKEYYTLSGQRVANPSAGVYICRQGDKVTKVIF